MSARVLIVDDSLTVRMSLMEALFEAGFAVTTVPTVAEAREALALEPFELIILDVRLPDGDGIDLLGEIRAGKGSSGAAVMLLSTEAEVRDRVRGLSTGADEYVGKPYDLNYVIQRAAELVRSAPAPGSRETVLIIEDSVTYREQLKEALEAAGYAVIGASTGEEGLRLAASARPAAVIVDGQLPGIDGGAVTRRIRMDAALRHLPCILLTGSEEREAEVRALDAGADAFVRKGEEIDVLLARLAAVLRSVDGPRVGEASSLVGPRKILAVDDSETYLQQVAQELRAEGYDVALARSGEEALELLTAQPVDCILLDLMMPGIGGHETCRRIKGTPILRGIPVIMLTALENREAMIQGLDAGADDYISKSSDFEVLRSRVLAQIRRKQFEDENRLIREHLAQKELEAVEARATRELEALEAVLNERKRNEVEMNKLQAELAHVSRWNAMGMMAATLAHELNQPLTAVSNFLEAARHMSKNLEGQQAGNISEMIENAMKQTARTGAIIRNLREFIEKRETSRSLENLNRVVEEAIALGTAGALYNDTRVEVDLDARLPPVMVNKVQIQQVLVNLCRNAFEAMKSARRRVLTVGTRLETPETVMITVSDTGPGIDPDVMTRLFQPFTTTKSEGMGIGLKICQSIVEAHGGEIWITPNEDEGVTFRVRLPIDEDEDA
ncbi:response regulator [Sphingomonas sp. LB-2]|uniref:response regulator n=1 Tax=Sphingomonas caeni TaxID=2984949 RepID=UPI00222E283C|nr:response regulator [Sphingomonas caeni]MCW3846582.1 response regulator [Sphingomonas caeni]